MRSDTRIATIGILTFGAEAQKLLAGRSPEAQNAAIREVVERVAEVAQSTVAGLVIHVDESALHAHFVLVGYDTDGQPLNASLYRKKLAQLQDVAAEVMAAHCPGFERGHRRADRLAAGATTADVTNRRVRQLREDLPAELAALEAEIEERRSKLPGLQARVDEMEGRVVELRAREERTVAEEKRLRTYEGRLNQRQEALTEAENEIGRLRGEIETREGAVTAREGTASDRESTVAGRETAADERETSVRAAETQFAAERAAFAAGVGLIADRAADPVPIGEAPGGAINKWRQIHDQQRFEQEKAVMTIRWPHELWDKLCRLAAPVRAREAALAEREAAADVRDNCLRTTLGAVMDGTLWPKPKPGTYGPGPAPEEQRRATWARDRQWLTHDFWRGVGAPIWHRVIRPLATRLGGTAPAPLPPGEGLAALLSTHDVQALTAKYAGHGGVGNVIEVVTNPPDCLPEATVSRIKELVWDIVEGERRGFATGDGGRGQLDWTPAADVKIAHVVFEKTEAAEVEAASEAAATATRSDDSASPT